MITPDQLVSTICAAATEVFSTMLDSDLRLTESYCNQGPSHPLDGVICLIGMTGACSGTGTVSCSAEFACRVASQMLMADYKEVNAEVLDAMAEVANMILGNVKTWLEESVGPMGMSIPTAIFGKNFLAKTFGDEIWTVVVFDCAEERLEVKLFLRPQPGAPAAGSAKTCTPVYLRG